MVSNIITQVEINWLVGAILAPFVALSGYWLTTGVVRLRQLWQIARKRLTAIGFLNPGEAEVMARVETTTTYQSPLSGQMCVAHYYTVERYILRSRSPTRTSSYSPYTAQEAEDERLKREGGEPRVQHWACVASESSERQFVLADKSGYVVVDPREAHMGFGRPQYVYEADAPDSGRYLPESLRKIVSEKQIDVNALLRFREWLIRPGEMVVAVGMVRETGQASASGKPGPVHYELCRSDSCDLVLTNLGRRSVMGFLSWQCGWRLIAGALLGVATTVVGMNLGRLFR